jgi:hypothetical protein
VKKLFLFVLSLSILTRVCDAQDLTSDVQTMESAYAGSGSIVALDSQTIVIAPKMPAPVCAVPKIEGGDITWKYYSFPLASITVPLASIDEKLIGQDVVFTKPDVEKSYKPGDVGDTTIVIVAGVPGKQFHTLLYDREKFLHLGPGPHTAKDYGQTPDDTEAFALTFSDPVAARSFAAALKNAVLLAKAQASLQPTESRGMAR